MVSRTSGLPHRSNWKSWRLPFIQANDSASNCQNIRASAGVRPKGNQSMGAVDARASGGDYSHLQSPILPR